LFKLINSQPQRRLNAVAFIVVLAIDVSLCLYLAAQIRGVADLPFATDEAVHANGGLELALDLKAGDIGGFIRSVYQQAYYPPMQSLLLAPAFILFGATETTARMVGLACLFAIVLLLYAIGLGLHERHGWLIGLIAALFAATSQPLLTESVMAMQEPVGLLFTLIGLWLYMRGVKRENDRYFVAASFALVAATLAKYLFGVYLVATFALARIVAARFNPRRLIARSNIALFIPFTVFMIAWFIDPAKQHDFWRYASVPSLQAEAGSFDHLTFYWRSLIVNFTSDPLLGILLIGGLIYGLLRWRDPIQWVLAVHVLAAIAGMTIRNTINPRFIYVAAPLAYPLAGAAVVKLIEVYRRWLRGRSESVRRPINLAAIGVVAVAFVFVVLPGVSARYMSYPALLEVRIKTDAREFAAFEWIAQAIPPERRKILMVNYWDQFSAEGLKWYLLSRDTTPGRRFEDVQVTPRFAEPVDAASIAGFVEGMRNLGVTELVGFAGGPEGNSGAWTESQPLIGQALQYVSDRGFEMAQWDRALLLRLRDNEFRDAQTLAEAMQKYNYGYFVIGAIYRVRVGS
jgi:hypothetical protein